MQLTHRCCSIHSSAYLSLLGRLGSSVLQNLHLVDDDYASDAELTDLQSHTLLVCTSILA